MASCQTERSSRFTHEEIRARVGAQLALLGVPGLDYTSLDERAHLIDDVGLDSLKFVDLTVALERSLEVAEFPMQEWVDEQVASGRALSVGELVRACEAVVSRHGADQQSVA